MTENQAFERIIDKIFSIDKDKFIILAILFVGLLLRIIAAINISVSADDMHHVTHAINFYNSGRLTTYDQSAGLWHTVTSIAYDIFGVNQFASRLASIIFGSATIIVVFFLTKEFFSKRIAFIAAFLTAIAPFHIRLTVAEMDVMAMFFSMLSIFFFVKALRTEKRFYFCASSIAMGLALYTKVYPVLFIPSLLLYGFYINKKTTNNPWPKKYIKNLIVFSVIVAIFAIPALAHNYLLYQEKGFLDLHFTQVFDLGREKSAQYYSFDAQFEAKNSWAGLFFGDKKHVASGMPLLLAAINYIRVGDPFVFFAGIIGLIIILLYQKQHRDYLVLFGWSILFVLPFLASIILLPKHYLFLELLVIPISAFAVSSTIEYVKKRFGKNILKLLILLSIVISFIWLGLANAGTTTHFFEKSAITKVIEFKEEKIPELSLIVFDSRIYRGQGHWMSYGRPYLEAQSFIEIINIQDDLPGPAVQTPVFFIECVQDDCGWGTIKDQPELNQSMEQLTALFNQQGALARSFTEPLKDLNYYPWQKGKELPRFNVYLATIPMKVHALSLASQPKEWFLYEIGYKNPEAQFDSYPTSNFLYKIARSIVLLSMVLSIISILYILYKIFTLDSSEKP